MRIAKDSRNAITNLLHAVIARRFIAEAIHTKQNLTYRHTEPLGKVSILANRV